jgi:DNA helicase HerA-like ATPase
MIVIDEYAELSEEAKDLADSLARLGRAVAVTLLVATQRPTQAAMLLMFRRPMTTIFATVARHPSASGP